MKNNVKILLAAVVLLLVGFGVMVFQKDMGGSVLEPKKEEVPGDPSPYDDVDAKLHIQKGIQLDPAKISIIKELKDVSLCGETYKTKQIFVDGVDVMQRFAELLKKDAQKEKSLCETLSYTFTKNVGGKIAQGEEIHIMLTENDSRLFNMSISLGVGLRDLNSGLPHSWVGGLVIRVDLEKNKLLAGTTDSESARMIDLGDLK